MVLKVHEIIEHSEGIIEAENFSGSALFNVSLSVNLCRPLKNQNIICKINKVNKELITLENGPILVIIANKRWNSEIFSIDNNNNIKYKKGNETTILTANDYVVATIINVVFNHGDDKIKTLGFLNNVATDEDIKKHFDALYDDTKNVDYDEYIKNLD